QKDSDKTRVTSPVVQDMGRADMGDARVLEDFIRWGVTTYPAKHYFVAVWDHGSGWRLKKARMNGELEINDISWDDNTGHSITTKQLGEVMNNVAAWLGRKIDIYGSDACLMGMVEIAGEMKNSVSYFIGSQETEPGEGWPYKQIFAPLVANPRMNIRDFTVLFADEYVKSYSGGSNGTNDGTMSAFDMSKYQLISNAVTNLSAELVRSPNDARSKISYAAKTAQSFAYSDYVDMGDFLKNLLAQQIRDINTSLILDAGEALKQFVVVSRNTSDYAKSTGASIWIPRDAYTMNRYLTKYQGLVFENETRWSEALKGFVGKSR
ncbi:MAG TPA: clostripain-related cysteine peptidase, partial [Bdellovibrionota bacterium]